MSSPRPSTPSRASPRSRNRSCSARPRRWCVEAEAMTELILFNAPQSTCSQRVRFVLEAKGLAFEERKLDLFAGDQLKPDYLKINPNGVVPSLMHDGRVVIDSSVIMEYLDEVFVAPERLVPEGPVERANMRAQMRFIDEVPAAAIRVPSYNIPFLPSFQAMSEEEFRALADSKPLRKEFLLTILVVDTARQETA